MMGSISNSTVRIALSLLHLDSTGMLATETLAKLH